jgi:hypothetical protein
MLDTVWLYRSPIPMGRRGVFHFYKDVYLPSRRLEEGGEGVVVPCGRDLSRVNNPSIGERADVTSYNISGMLIILLGKGASFRSLIYNQT